MKKATFIILSLAALKLGAQQWQSNGTNIYNSNSGNVAIGTPTSTPPANRLHVQTNATNDGIRVTQTGFGASSLWLTNNTTGGRTWLAMSTGQGNAEGTGNFNLVEYNQPQSGPATSFSRFFIRGGQNGQVGLNTTNPQAYLHISAPDHGSGIFVGHGNTNPAYGIMIRAKNNFSKSFVVENHVDAPQYESFIVYGNGRTKIGRNFSSFHQDAMLSVNGKIVCQDLYVTDINDWPDYVFSKEIKLKDLESIKSYYEANCHLPGVPSAKEISEGGVNLKSIIKVQMEKIEELSIYLIQLNEELNRLKRDLEMSNKQKK